jgi:hypothetical protein
MAPHRRKHRKKLLDRLAVTLIVATVIIVLVGGAYIGFHNIPSLRN